MDGARAPLYRVGMTHDQYTEIVGFLEQKFEEVQRHSTALFEQNRGELRIFAEGTNARFDKVDERLDTIDERLDTMDQRLDKVDERLDKVDQRLNTMDHRLDKVDGRLDTMDQRLVTMDERLDTMDERLHTMDERFDTRLGSLEGWVRRAVTDHESRPQALE